MRKAGGLPGDGAVLGRREVLRSLAATPVFLAALARRGQGVGDGTPLRLEPLYRVEFRYRESFGFRIEGAANGSEWQYFALLEGRATGSIPGRMVGANHARRRVDNRFLPDLQGVIEVDDGATVYFDQQGIAGAHPSGAWSVLTTVQHVSEAEAYRRLNGAWCVGIGDASTDDIVIDVRELVWEPVLGEEEGGAGPP